MNTYVRISDEALVVESIRRLRGRLIPKVDYVAHEGVKPSRLVETLVENQMITAIRLLEVLNQLMENGGIVTCGMYTIYGESESHPKKLNRSKRGLISRFHPDVKLGNSQWFTDEGTPITVYHRQNRLVHVPDSPTKILLRKLNIYVTADGMPKTVETAQKKSPINFWY